MAIYCVRRILLALLLVWIAASTAFVLTRFAPGDATFVEEQFLAPAAREARRAQLGLDRPLAAQYAGWLAGMLRLDFGESSLYARPVGQLLRERTVNTAILAITALLLATVLGVPAGIYTGRPRSGLTVPLVRGVSVTLVSLPPLVGSLLLVLLAARTGWLPTGGMTSADGSASWAAWLGDVAAHLPVPALALALPLAATLERLQSRALAEAAGEPFVDAARARGVSSRDALVRHAWPASLAPLLGLYGLMVGTLFSGSFVVEVVTAWPGIGRLMVDALRARDLFLVAGAAAAGAMCLATATLITDVLHAWLDPRIRERA
ncbi:MAG: ABC transporter permease [Acidobacteria bacterium]|nr:ABC transporter permease [Acidobacteriota bacterium]